MTYARRIASLTCAGLAAAPPSSAGTATSATGVFEVELVQLSKTLVMLEVR